MYPSTLRHTLAVAVGLALCTPITATWPAEPAGAIRPQERYALNLTTSPTPLRNLTLYRRQFAGWTVYQTRTQRHGKEVYVARVGFFRDANKAAEALQRIKSHYPFAWVDAVSEPEFASAREAQQAGLHTPIVIVAAVAIPPAPTPQQRMQQIAATKVTPVAAVVKGTTDVEKKAAVLLAQAKDALTAKKNEEAISLLNNLLRLPLNSATREARELLGLAYERFGAVRRAREEYAIYLKLYPEGEATERVRQRLTNLERPEAEEKARVARQRRERPPVTLVYGGLSQTYYRGSSKVETKPFDINGNPLNTTTLTATDQSALITSVDLTHRYRSERFDNRFVFRDTNTQNFLENSRDVNRLNAVYYDFRDKQLDAGGRLGRQPGSTAGILLPFDGVRLNYGLSSTVRLNVQGGNLVDFYSPYDKKFTGFSVDLGPYAQHWSGSVYSIKQEVDGVSDREAVGLELRFFAPRSSLLFVVDYDTSYSLLNTAMFQGTWTTSNKVTYNLLVDHRQSPPIMTTNALIGETVTSIREMLLTLTEEQIRRIAVARTAEVNMAQFGATRPVSEKWQLGGDVQVTKISGTQTINGVTGQPGIDNQYTYSVQMTGVGIFTKRDSLTFRGSYIDAPTFAGNALSAFYRSLLGPRWTMDLTVTQYNQEDNLGTKLDRLTPTLKLGYRQKPNLTFEFEFGIENSTTRSTTTEDKTNRKFGSVGYRWDFN
jgi:tetratricopeptide (TPR) repeat protein